MEGWEEMTEDVADELHETLARLEILLTELRWERDQAKEKVSELLGELDRLTDEMNYVDDPEIYV